MKERQSIYLIYEFLSEHGGLERLLINNANFLREAGYDVKILTCHLDRKNIKSFDFGDIEVEEISRIKTPFEWINMALCFLGLNKLKEYNPSAFISYSAPCNFLIRKKNCKKIQYINHYPHFLYLDGKEKWEWALRTPGLKRKIALLLSWFLGGYLRKTDRQLIRKNKLIFMNSNFTKKKLEKLYSIKDTIVNYPPISPEFKPSKRKIDKRYIFSSGRIVPDKKYEWLIEACSLMKKKLPVYISGVGEESYQQQLTNLAKKKNVEIRFLGRLSTNVLVDYYTNAQVFAFTTPSEDFGLTPIESISCGTPVVVWGDGSGPTEQVINSVNGFWAKPYDLRDFASKLDKIIDSRMKLKKGKKIIQSARKFSYKEIRKGFLGEIERILRSS